MLRLCVTCFFIIYINVSAGPITLFVAYNQTEAEHKNIICLTSNVLSSMGFELYPNDIFIKLRYEHTEYVEAMGGGGGIVIWLLTIYIHICEENAESDGQPQNLF